MEDQKEGGAGLVTLVTTGLILAAPGCYMGTPRATAKWVQNPEPRTVVRADRGRPIRTVKHDRHIFADTPDDSRRWNQRGSKKIIADTTVVEDPFTGGTLEVQEYRRGVRVHPEGARRLTPPKGAFDIQKMLQFFAQALKQPDMYGNSRAHRTMLQQLNRGGIVTVRALTYNTKGADYLLACEFHGLMGQVSMLTGKCYFDGKGGKLDGIVDRVYDDSIVVQPGGKKKSWYITGCLQDKSVKGRPDKCVPFTRVRPYDRLKQTGNYQKLLRRIAHNARYR
jgi:hypothetical protein